MPYEFRDGGGFIIEYASVLDPLFVGPWVEVEGVTGDITLPGVTPSKVDVTTHRGLLTNKFTANAAGIGEVTDLSFDIFLDIMNVTHQQLLADIAVLAVRDYRITFPPGGVTPVTTKWGVRGGIGMTNRGVMKGKQMSTVTVMAQVVDFSV